MNYIPFSFLACPLDGLPLTGDTQSVHCAKGHSFDFDRKGTLNLLPVQFKKSKNPGDSKEMVLARQQFLDGGFYKPISDTLNRIIAERSEKEPVIFDAGCGEGYYTDLLAKHLLQTRAISIAGMDISKDAIHEAAKRHRAIQWIVGTNAKIPVQDQSVDYITSLFGFAVWPEFTRILKPGGIVITADPGPEHLIELRQVLYPEIKEKTHSETPVQGFSLINTVVLKTTQPAPPSAQIGNQIIMTPHGYRAPLERREAALNHRFQQMTLDVVFKVYQKQ